MKKLFVFLVLCLCGCVTVKAQYANGPVDGPLSYKWGGIYNADGQRLSKEDAFTNYFTTPEYQRRFKRGRNDYFIGAGLAVTGAAMSLLATQLDPSGIGSEAVGGMYLVSIVYGYPAFVTGTVLFFVGRHKLKDLTADYNYEHGQKKVSMNFGPQEHGIGFALNF